MTKHSDDLDRRSEEARNRAAKEREDHDARQKLKGDKNQDRLGEIPEPGSRDPGYTIMSNPPPQHVEVPIPEPTDDPMSTPPAGPLPNPVSRPGGDPTGDVNYTATGEKLDPDHPDYRKDAEGQRSPDHRTAEEKKANPRT